MLFLNYYSTHRGPFDEARIMEAQREMDLIVKEIELYKMSYGRYPDSLPALKSNNSDIKITDPIQSVHPGQEQYYFYKLKNQRYYFFSKGFDGLPFTKDDITPLFKGIDPNKIGIIQ